MSETNKRLNTWLDCNDKSMMSAIQNRIIQLRDVISWSFENGGLTPGQRICIHQEIAGLMAEQDALTNGSFLHGTYKIPAELEQKVRHFTGVIKNTGWEKEEIKY